MMAPVTRQLSDHKNCDRPNPLLRYGIFGTTTSSLWSFGLVLVEVGTGEISLETGVTIKGFEKAVKY